MYKLHIISHFLDHMIKCSLRTSANERTVFGHVINTVINSFILIKILLLITSKTYERILKLTPIYN